MKVWITKYALTKGIIEAEGEYDPNYPTMVRVDGYLSSFHKPYWHTTEAEAIKHAEYMKLTKLESLTRQFTKLQNMNFYPIPK